MKLLLDTHTLLWYLDDDKKLSANARAMIQDPAQQKFVSLVSCWEIAIKVGLKKLDLGEPATTFLPHHIQLNNFDLLSIELSHVLFVETLPHHHGDPFDRLLIAQSLIESLPIASKDPVFDQYGVTRLW